MLVFEKEKSISLIFNNLTKCEIDAVEIDEEIAKAAKDWFGLIEDDKTRVHVDDGIKFINDASKIGKKWDVVIIDVNNDNAESDLWCPTKDFIELEFLKTCSSVLKENGIFIVNVICRNDSLKLQVFEKFKSFWPSIFINKLKKSRNEIVFSATSNTYFEKYDFNNDQNLNETNRKLFIQMENNLVKF
jgi:spermidine synthase